MLKTRIKEVSFLYCQKYGNRGVSKRGQEIPSVVGGTKGIRTIPNDQLVAKRGPTDTSALSEECGIYQVGPCSTRLDQWFPTWGLRSWEGGRRVTARSLQILMCANC